MFVKNQPGQYRGQFALRGTPLGDYQKVTFVLPSNTTTPLAGMGQLSNLTPTAWLGIGAAALAVYWFGFRKKSAII